LWLKSLQVAEKLVFTPNQKLVFKPNQTAEVDLSEILSILMYCFSSVSTWLQFIENTYQYSFKDLFSDLDCDWFLGRLIWFMSYFYPMRTS
jgi:hypothetical protein